MKIKFDIDCTPEELRAFMGLPDVRPLQASLMKDLETRIKDTADRMAPENIIKSWFSLLPVQSEQLRNMINAMISGSTSKVSTSDPSKEK